MFVLDDVWSVRVRRHTGSSWRTLTLNVELVHGGLKRLHILKAREQIISSVDSSTLPRSSLSWRRSDRCSPGSADVSQGGCCPVVYATPLPVAFETLLTHWSAVFYPPPQHEPASSAEGLTQVCDQSIIALPVGRLRGRRSTQLRLRKHWNDHLHRSSQRVDVLDLGVDVLLLGSSLRPRRILAATLPERGSLRSVCRSQSSF